MSKPVKTWVNFVVNFLTEFWNYDTFINHVFLGFFLIFFFIYIHISTLLFNSPKWRWHFYLDPTKYELDQRSLQWRDELTSFVENHWATSGPGMNRGIISDPLFASTGLKSNLCSAHCQHPLPPRWVTSYGESL